MNSIKLLPFAALLAFSGCGLIYTDVRVPRSYRTAVPSEIKSTPEDPVVTGKACNTAVLYLIALGDGGYAAATRKALEGRPDHILYDVKSDVEVTSVLLGLYARSCTRVTGKAAKP
jgi:hypothetical protein